MSSARMVNHLLVSSTSTTTVVSSILHIYDDGFYHPESYADDNYNETVEEDMPVGEDNSCLRVPPATHGKMREDNPKLGLQVVHRIPECNIENEHERCRYQKHQTCFDYPAARHLSHRPLLFTQCYDDKRYDKQEQADERRIVYCKLCKCEGILMILT